MPEIKIKHISSFSSEDKVHKAENLLKEETYRKWTCATPGEKSASVVLQFEKATQIHSIDIGNENSAFVEILVGRSSDSLNDFQVLLVASSFMSPLESRTGTHKNRVRMFGPEKLSQNVKNEKWDCVQIVCTQPFNKNTTFGLTFIKFHSPPEKVEEEPKSSEAGKATAKLGAFKIKYDEDDEDTQPAVGSWFGKKKTRDSESSNSSLNKDAPSFAAAILSSRNSPSTVSSQNATPKRKSEEGSGSSQEHPSKKPTTSILNKDHIIFKDILDGKTGNKKTANEKRDSERNASNAKAAEVKKTKPKNNNMRDKADTSSTAQAKGKKNVPFGKLMDKVVIVLSGFVNPLRGDLRDKALEMGAKYKADWDSSCTHLICAFLNTPKYDQVDKLRGKIVSKEWILDCYKKKQLLPWEKYILGKPSKDLPSSEEEAEFTEESEDEDDISDFDDSEDSDDEYVVGKKTKGFSFLTGDKTKPKPPRVPSKRKDASPSSDKRKKKDSTPNKKVAPSTSNTRDDVSDGSCSPSLVAPGGSRDESETEDEEALQDYRADTDVESESGGDTEDEIRKVEQKAQKKQEKSPRKANGLKMEVELSEKPDISDLSLPELPNIFKQKHFFLYGDFNTSKEHELQRYITAYNGILEDYMSDKIKYVITEKKWDKNFDDALNDNEDLIFVKSAWIYKCHEAGKLVPYQPYIVIPDS